jgi:hypothetical protein
MPFMRSTSRFRRLACALPLVSAFTFTAALVPVVSLASAWAQTAAPAVPLELALPAALAQDIDPAIARVLASTRAIDNHAHPMLSPPAMATDRNFDALPVDNMEPQTDPLAWRPDYPPLRTAWFALYGFDSGDAPLPLTGAAAARLEAAREAVRTREGTHYAVWVLNQAGIDTMLANRVSMGTGVEPPRFRWVPYIDTLLFPLNNKALGAVSPDRAQFFALEDILRARYIADSGVKALPPTLDGYLNQVVLPTLQR